VGKKAEKEKKERKKDQNNFFQGRTTGVG